MKKDNPTEKRKYSKLKSKRKDYRKKCMLYTVEESILYRFVKFGRFKADKDKASSEGMTYKARVAKRGQVNATLFRQFHHEKGHTGMRQGRETLRQH